MLFSIAGLAISVVFNNEISNEKTAFGMLVTQVMIHIFYRYQFTFVIAAISEVSKNVHFFPFKVSFSVYKMSRETTLRYECNWKGNAMQRQRNLQKERIKQDEIIDRKIKKTKQINDLNLQAEWMENMETTRNISMQRKNRTDMKFELKMADRAILKVRRAELKKVLEEEEADITRRLDEKGLVIYHERV